MPSAVALFSLIIPCTSFELVSWFNESQSISASGSFLVSRKLVTISAFNSFLNVEDSFMYSLILLLFSISLSHTSCALISVDAIPFSSIVTLLLYWSLAYGTLSQLPSLSVAVSNVITYIAEQIKATIIHIIAKIIIIGLNAAIIAFFTTFFTFCICLFDWSSI